ncbi:MAG: hypothetical protein ACP6IQ_00015 [Candidatus Njordarchaeia archaeon]|nr:hypothetical protein [Candidatus Korarchaeota archaeon]
MPKKISLVIICLFLLSTSTMIYGLKANDEQGKLVREIFNILIDEGHGPIFGHRELMDALNYLNKTLKVRVYVNTESIDYTKLAGIDLVIIPPSNGSIAYTQQERKAFKSYTMYGGAILLLGIPLRNDGTNMNPLEFNSIIRTIFDSSPFMYYEKDGMGDIIYDDIHASGEILNLSVEMLHTNITELFENITTINIRSTSIRILDDKNVKMINLQASAYSVSKDGTINYNNGTITIMASKEISRGILTAIGFGEAFTNIKSPYGSPWIDLEGNKNLFKNIILWILRLNRWFKEDIKPAQDIYLYYIITSGISFSLYYIMFKREQREEILKRKAKETIKPSEIIKKIREKKE